uniref:Uncharacterized protein n=1 Tax=Meloidogyne enterolobii TaxID=390850 RepID=A0A6V7WK64_MELEN|nr:unnamed protein product [Meloidogyne enterolobii]
MSQSNILTPLTAARREKFKCSFFCFRTSVEDATFFISVFCILSSLLIFILHSKSSQFLKDEMFTDKVFLLTTFSVIINVFVIIALFTRIAAFLWPFIIIQAIGILINSNFLFIMAMTVLETFLNTLKGYSFKISIDQQYRFEKLNGFVVLGLIFLFQLKIFSIIWGSYNAIKLEQITKKLAEELENIKIGENNKKIITTCSTSKIVF